MANRPADAARSLADQLRGWSDDRLTALLRARPDLARPVPQDSTQLATRAATSASVTSALAALNTLELATLDAVVVLSGAEGGATEDDVLAVVYADQAATRLALDHLQSLCLVWAAPSGLRALTTVADALTAAPVASTWVASGCRPFAGIPDAADRLQRLSPEATALVRHVDDNGGTATTSARTVAVEQATTPVEEVLAHGLLTGTGQRFLPGEVALVLRGGHTTREPVDAVPAVATTDRDPALIDRTGAGTAFEVVRRLELLLDQWGLRPPAVLRSGGLSVRDLKAAAGLLHVDEVEAALLVEVAQAAGLLAMGLDRDGEEVWLPTDAFDRWAQDPAADRWVSVVAAWLSLPRAPGLVGTKDRTGKGRNALSPDLALPHTLETRRLTLAALAELPTGATLAAGTGVSSLIARLEWLRPRRPAARRQLAGWAVAEARMLGLLGLDGLTTTGRSLLSMSDDQIGAHQVAATLAPLLPVPVDHILLQADLTAVAPGPLEAALAADLHLLADVESRGGATVHRFTAGSIRRGFDAGWSAADIHAFLAKASRTPVPQPLTYLVDDTGRRYGTLRVGQADAFLRADDESALTELLHHRAAATLGLRRLAPTVLISSTPLDVLLPRLRDLGLAPAVEAPDGTVHVARPDLMRARSPRGRRPAAVTEARTTAELAGVVSAMHAGDRAVAARPGQRPLTPGDALALLREAIESRREVFIGYVDNHGRTYERIVAPRSIDGGRLRGYDARTDSDLEFALHRITSARMLDA